MNYRMVWQRLSGREGNTSPPHMNESSEEGTPAMNTQIEQLQRDFEAARARLAESKAELERLRAECRAMPAKMRIAEWDFNNALKALGEAKSRVPL